MKPRFEATACLLALAALACNRHQPSATKSPASAAPRASALAPPVVHNRCRALHAGMGFVIGDQGGSDSGPGDGGTDDDEQPFGIELGSAAAFRGGFAVGALTLQGQTRALLAIVDRQGGHGKSVDLGATHGGQDAPRVAARGDQLIVAVPDSDASGRMFRLASVHDVTTRPRVEWGVQPPAGGSRSEVFALEVGATHGVLAWDAFERSGKRSLVRAVFFDSNDVSKATPPRVMSGEGEDVHTPVLAARSQGFWLGWIEEPKKAKPGEAPANRRVQIVPLDESGAPAHAPIAVTPAGAQVLAYTVAPLPGGGALVAWRADDDASPGIEGGEARLTRVAPDGSVEQREVGDKQPTVGIPALLFDAEATPPKAPLWLAVDDETGVTLLEAAGADAAPLDSLVAEPEVARADPLAVAGGRMLIARPERLAAELRVLECVPGTRAPSRAAPSASATVGGSDVSDDEPGPADSEAQ